jgi:hypothetical protein
MTDLARVVFERDALKRLTKVLEKRLVALEKRMKKVEARMDRERSERFAGYPGYD